METVIFDMDGTLSDPAHRRHHVTSKPKNWTAFNAGIAHDAPNEPIVRLARHMAEHYKIVVCSGREAVFRDVTLEWMERHTVPFHGLYMRAAKDYRDDGIVKSELLDQILADGFRPWLVVEDRNRVVDMWRARGLTCMQCAPGDF